MRIIEDWARFSCPCGVAKKGPGSIKSTTIRPSNLRSVIHANDQHVLGILVAMYVLDTDRHHHPHIHVRYNEFKAILKIPGGEVLEGELPSRQMKLVQAWIELHQDDLMADWHLASTGQTPFKIDPLR